MADERQTQALPERSPQVVVVGAGPVGLTLALGLARASREVLVLEKEPGTAEHSRAPAIWPATQEVLARLDVLPRFLDAGLCLTELRLHDADRGGVLVTLPIHELAHETPHARLLILPQAETQRLLLAALRSLPTVTVLFSAEVRDVTQDGAGVTVRYRVGGRDRRVHCAFAVGCDGGRSTVRRGLGARFDGETYATRAALADIRLAEDRPFPFPRLTTRDAPAIGIRLDARTWRLILPIAEATEVDLPGRVRRAVARLFEGATDYEPIWQSDFSLHRRIASRFTVGRIALAGDAAHLNSPVGGQGMNAGIHDAELLTGALIEALECGDARPLAAYEHARRRAVRRQVNRFTDILTRVLLARRGRLLRPALVAAGIALRSRPVRMRMLRRVAMLDARVRP